MLRPTTPMAGEQPGDWQPLYLNAKPKRKLIPYVPSIDLGKSAPKASKRAAEKKDQPKEEKKRQDSPAKHKKEEESRPAGKNLKPAAAIEKQKQIIKRA